MRKSFYSCLFFLGFSSVFPSFIQAKADPFSEQTSPGEAAGNSLSSQATPIPALPEVIVTANRLQIPVSQAASSVDVITAKELQSKQASTVLEALRQVPGLDVVLSGSSGQVSSVFIRGANAEHTLILLDGIPLNDPISTGRLYEGLDQLSTEDIDRIEVVRGPQSPLYGSNAMGGVINIITKKGSKGLAGSLLLELGEYQTFRRAASFSGADDQGYFSLSASRFSTGGFSTADKIFGNKLPNSDANNTASLRVGGTLLTDWNSDLFVRYNESHTALDGYQDVPPYALVDDPNYFVDGRDLVLKGTSTLKLLDGAWEQVLGLSLSDNLRKYADDMDSPADLYGYSRSNYEGTILQADLQNNLHLLKEETLVLGVQALREWGYEGDDYGYGLTALNATADTGSVFLESQTSLEDRFFGTLGGRMDAYSTYGTHFTYRAGLAYFIPGPETKLKATYGTGFKTPSLYQLYSFYGDTSLQPEESTGWDTGLEQGFFQDKIRIGATYFHNDFKELIDFNGLTSKYYNVGKAMTQGLEAFLSISPLEGLTLRTTYTYTEAKNQVTDEELLRRPWHKGNLDIAYKTGAFELGTDLIYVGERKDFGLSGVIDMPDHFLVNLRLSYQVVKELRIYGRLDNVFNEVYEEIYGYGTPGPSVFVGTEWSL